MIIFEANRIINQKELHVENAFLDKDRMFLPEYAGIYFVFVGSVEHFHDETFKMKAPRLIYIGQAKNINSRHNADNGSPAHEHYEDFDNERGNGEEIAYAFAPVGNLFDRLLIESSLIYQFKPCINIKDKYKFTHRPTRIKIESDIEFPYAGTHDVEQAK